MNNLPKKVIFTLTCLLATCLISYALLIKGPFTIKNHQNTLQTQEKALWDEFSQKGITHKQLKKLKKKNKNLYTKSMEAYEKEMCSPTPLSPATISLINTVLSDFGFKKNKVKILSYTFQSPAASHDGKALLINEEIFTQFSLVAQKFLVAHELIHIMNQDSITEFCINQYANQNPSIDFKDLLERYSRYCEIRADFYAASKSAEYAQGYLAFMREVLVDEETEFYAQPLPTHPDDHERLHLAQNITDHYQRVV